VFSEGWEGGELDVCNLALGKIRFVGIGRGLIGQNWGDAGIGSFQFVATLVELARDTSHELNDEAFHEFVIIEERTGVKFVGIFSAENTRIDLGRIGMGDLMKDKVGILSKVDGAIMMIMILFR
jgi:hypothetical protein